MGDIIFPDGTTLASLTGSETGTDNPSFTIDEDNVGAAVDTSLVFERGSSGTDSEVFCTGATGNIGIKHAGTTVLEANATNIVTTKPIVLGPDAAEKTRIYGEETGALEIDMVFEVETGQSFIFRTVA